MNYQGTLIAVQDIAKARQFYQDVMGLDVTLDVGENVQMTDGIFLQTIDSWGDFIHKPQADIRLANNAIELYFETDDMDTFIEMLEKRNDIEYLHPVIEHEWGQRAVRFYDLDKHIIEVAETIVMVIKRFIASGLTIEETAERTGGTVEYIQTLLDNR